MLFNSYPFVFFFLPLVLAGFLLLSAFNLRRLTPLLIIIASLCFYAWWDWHYLFLFLFSIGFNFFWAQLLHGPKVGETAGDRSRQKLLLGVGVAVNVALLGYFKYRDFFVGSLDVVLGWHVPLAHMALPLAISFFTFEQITYLVSAYRDEIAEQNLINYGLFITFFPHLIAGPIVRFKEIYPQFNRHSSFRLSVADLNEGLMIFAIGLFKKVMLADSFRPMASAIIDKVPHASFWDGWGAMIAFALQVYFDFSGYSDMAIGLARMFSVRFPENFDSPYKSLSGIELWRRWHITLSFFLRDYVYIPLGGNRKGELRRYLNLFLTMALCGLWHGANWTFVLWGIIQGVIVIINHLWRRLKIDLPVALCWALTFFSWVVSLVFFRAPSMERVSAVLTSMTGINGFAFNPDAYSLGWPEYKWILAGMIIVVFLPNRQQIMEWRWKSDYLYAGAFALLAGISLLQISNPPPFIYFQF